MSDRYVLVSASYLAKLRNRSYFCINVDTDKMLLEKNKGLGVNSFSYFPLLILKIVHLPLTFSFLLLISLNILWTLHILHEY